MKRVAIAVFLVGCGGRAPAPTAPASTVEPPTEVTAEEPARDDGPPAPAPPLPMIGDKAAHVCLTSDPEAAARYEEGVERYDDGDAAGAITAYEAAIARDPRFCDAMDNLAVIYRRSNRLDEAIALYEKSIELAPHNQFAWQNIGVAYRMRGRLADATRAYERLTVLSPDNPEGWFGFGQVALVAGHPEQARDALRRAEALYLAADSPLVGDARLLLGLAAGRLRDWPTVRAALAPDDVGARSPEASVFLGEAFLQPDALDVARARAYLETARALGATVPDALWKRANP